MLCIFDIVRKLLSIGDEVLIDELFAIKILNKHVNEQNLYLLHIN